MKKIIKISGIVACAAVLFFNVSLSGKKNANNMNLSSLTKISEANAECIGEGRAEPGRCMAQYGVGVCIQNFVNYNNECDPTYSL